MLSGALESPYLFLSHHSSTRIAHNHNTNINAPSNPLSLSISLHQARYAVRNMFLGNTEKQSDLLIPWCTYTEPEVAHVGKYESELDAKGVEYDVCAYSSCSSYSSYLDCVD